MSMCPVCRRYEVQDPETGYHGADICPWCAQEGWDMDARGEVFQHETLQQRMDRLHATLIREDGRLERLCEHGVGHPVGHVTKFERWMLVHGCCGCCREYVVDERVREEKA